ncbi:MAG: hypothetical protein RLZZ241_679 [Bacteroidota bacterium]
MILESAMYFITRAIFVCNLNLLLKKRLIDIAVLSNLKLGSNTCKAEELLTYLNSIKPGLILLSGGIFDDSLLYAKKWPQEHIQVLLKLLDFATSGSDILYLGSKNDVAANKLADTFHIKFKIVKKLTIMTQESKIKFIANEKDSEKYESNIEKNRLVYKLIHRGYTHLILNSDQKSTKNWMDLPQGKICIMTSGNWTHAPSALEFAFKRWKTYHFSEDKLTAFYADEAIKTMGYKEILQSAHFKSKTH